MMYIQVKWHIKGRLLLLTGEGVIDYETLTAAIHEAKSYLDRSDQPLVHLLIDARNASSDIKSLKDRVDVLRPVLSHPKCGWSVMIGSGTPFANFLLTTAAQIFKARFRSFKTPQEAIRFLIDVVPDMDQIPVLESESE